MNAILKDFRETQIRDHERLSDQLAKASLSEAEVFVRDLLWNQHPECCGCPVVGAEYMGSQEMICCGNPDPCELSDAQIVASLVARFPPEVLSDSDSAAAPPPGKTLTSDERLKALIEKVLQAVADCSKAIDQLPSTDRMFRARACTADAYRLIEDAEGLVRMERRGEVL